MQRGKAAVLRVIRKAKSPTSLLIAGLEISARDAGGSQWEALHVEFLDGIKL